MQRPLASRWTEPETPAMNGERVTPNACSRPAWRVC